MLMWLIEAMGPIGTQPPKGKTWQEGGSVSIGLQTFYPKSHTMPLISIA